MAEYLAPGVYVEEFDSGVKAMEGVGTSTAGFVGLAARGPVVGRPVLLTSFADYKRRFGGYLSELEFGGYRYLPNSVEQFFANGGSTCYVMRVAPENAVAAKSADGPIVVAAKDPGAWANTMRPMCCGYIVRKAMSRSRPVGQTKMTGNSSKPVPATQSHGMILRIKPASRCKAPADCR